MQFAKAGNPGHLASIDALKDFAIQSSTTTLNVAGYFAGSTLGGGQFIW
jgi:hypothetical protein